MDTKLHIVAGPPTNEVTREVAEKDLRAHPNFPKNASVVIDEVEGRWVAAIHVATEDLTKESAPPPFGGGEGGPPAAEEAPAEESAPPSDEGEEGPPKEEGEEKPKGDEEGKPKGEHGVEAQLHAVTEMLHTLMSALGLAPNPADSMVPGAEAGPPGMGGPPGAGGPPAPGGAHGVGPDGKQRVVHERGLKPGEAPPGSTPVGAPAFASTEKEAFADHPWKGVIGKVRTFTATEEIGEDESLAAIEQEIKQLAEGTGYEIKQLREGREDGKRLASVLLSR